MILSTGDLQRAANLSEAIDDLQKTIDNLKSRSQLTPRTLEFNVYAGEKCEFTLNVPDLIEVLQKRQNQYKDMLFELGVEYNASN